MKTTDTNTIDTAKRLQISHNKFESLDHDRILPVTQEFANEASGTEAASDENETLMHSHPEYFYG